MKTENIIFEDIYSLEKKIDLLSIKNQKNLLIQVFTASHDKLYINKIITFLHQKLPSAIIIGTTTAGEIIDNKVFSNSTILSFTSFEKTKICCGLKTGTNSYAMGYELANEIVHTDTKAVIMFADGFINKPYELIEGFSAAAPGIPIAGGLAGDNLEMKRTFVFDHKTLDSNSVVAVSLSGTDLQVFTKYSFCWNAVGKKMRVTKSSDGRIYEIDNYPTVDIYEKYLGKDVANELPASAIEFPLILEKNGLQIGRAALKKYEDGSLEFVGNIKQGESVQFGYGNIETIISDSLEIVCQFQDVLIESVFIYSCVARKALLGDVISTEILPFFKIAPTAGFFTYGEFFSAGEINEILNETMTVLGMSEGGQNHKELWNNKHCEKAKPVYSKQTSIIKALSTLVNRVTRELNDINEDLYIQNTKLLDFIDIAGKRTVELKQAKEIAEKAIKTKNEFMANMSHEIRTPMNAIIGFSDLIKKTEMTEQQYNYMNKIDSSAKALLSIINDILDFSDLEAGKLTFVNESFELDEVIDNLIDMISFDAAAKKIRIDYEIDKNVPVALIGDKHRLEQIVLNLLNNAVKFTIKGQVSLKIQLVELNKKVCVIKFNVIDTGIGLSLEHRNNLFLPFYQEDSSLTRGFGGTGLGLTICKSLVEMMKGTISVESELGVGSTFSFTAEFTLQQGKKKNSDKKDIIDVGQQLNGIKILLVEDTLFNQEVAKEILISKGMVVEIANNGKEAVEAVARTNYDLVLMDIQMPIMGGYEATKLIRSIKKNQHLAIVAMTAHSKKEIIEDCIKVGINDYINKPINPAKLYSVIKKWVSIEPRAASNDTMHPKQANNENNAEEDLPEAFTGIDIMSGLNRINGNRKLYKKLLQNFFQDYLTSAIEIKRAMNEENADTAIRLAHTLKGVAGNISAYNVYDKADKVEAALLSRNMEEYNTRIFELDKELKILKSQIKLIERLEPEDNINCEKTINTKEFEAILKSMLEFIKEDNIEVENSLKDLQKCLGLQFKEEMLIIDKSINDFEFANAIEPLKKIAEKMKIVSFEES